MKKVILCAKVRPNIKKAIEKKAKADKRSPSYIVNELLEEIAKEKGWK